MSTTEETAAAEQPTSSDEVAAPELEAEVAVASNEEPEDEPTRALDHADAPEEGAEQAADVELTRAPPRKGRAAPAAERIPEDVSPNWSASSKAHQAPAYTFAGARPATAPTLLSTSAANEPGPASFDPQPVHLSRSPAYSFNGASRKSGGPEASKPGPGSYDPQRVNLPRSPAFTMGRGADNAPPKKRETLLAPPGPGGPGPGETFDASGVLVIGAAKGAAAAGSDGATGGDGATSASVADSLAAKAAAGGLLSAEEVAELKRASSGGASSGGASSGGVPSGGASGFASNLSGEGIDWVALSAKLPTGMDGASRARRKELWKRSDPNGNGFLSAAEVDLMVKHAVGDGLFSAKPVLLLAFHAARRAGDTADKGGDKGDDKGGDGRQVAGSRAADYVERCEFRTLLVALRQYYELYAMFNRLDTSDDRRIDRGEFAAGVAKLKTWGVTVDDADAEFDAIDADGGGKILFDEFCKWAIPQALDLEDDDDVATTDAERRALARAEGYVAERAKGGGAKGGGAKGGGAKYTVFGPGARVKLCYSHVGAVVPLQMTARFEPASPLDNPTVNRKGYSHEMPPEHTGARAVLGGVPAASRQLIPPTHQPHKPLRPTQPPKGLPYALAQLLLETAQKDYEAAYTPATPATTATTATPSRLTASRAHATKGGAQPGAKHGAKPGAKPSAKPSANGLLTGTSAPQRVA